MDEDGGAGEAPESKGEVPSFLAHVGDNVRAARRCRGMSRRELSCASGVSQRYLADLETGSGNVSIGLLFRIAKALHRRVEQLVGAAPSSEVDTLITRFCAAPPERREAALRALGVALSPGRTRRGLALIGLRGAGKSTLGPRLAARLSLPFVELNREIEAQSGMPVAEIMALYGQEGYRRLERQALERVRREHPDLVLSVAGGIVSEAETFNFLLREFDTVWLKASPEEHMERVRAQGDERPMAGHSQALDDLRSILVRRAELYARASACVDTSGQSVEQSERDLLAVVRRLNPF